MQLTKKAVKVLQLQKYAVTIDGLQGVLGGQTPPLRLKIWADPPSWKIFEQVTP